MSKHVKNYNEFVNEQKALLEYDRSGFRHKYSSLPQDRMDKIMDYSKERQIKNGISFTRNGGKDVLYVTPSDIGRIRVGNERFIKSMENAHKICSGDYKHSNGDIDYESLHRDFKGVDFKIFNKHLNGLNDKIDFWLSFSIDNVVSGVHDSLTENGHISGTLVKMTDKFAPPFQFNVSRVNMDANLTPLTQKDNIKFIKILEKIILDEFKDPRGFPYIQSVKIDRNAVFK